MPQTTKAHESQVIQTFEPRLEANTSNPQQHQFATGMSSLTGYQEAVINENPGMESGAVTPMPDELEAPIINLE